MLLRKMKCGTCGTSKNSATGKTLYALVDTAVLQAGINSVTECWDCGDARRKAEEAKKQHRITRLLNDAE